jgi:prevent-host-death family protein
MRYSTQVKPISFLKAKSAEVLERLAQDRQPVVITQNGEAKAVLHVEGACAWGRSDRGRTNQADPQRD